jgi:hypothetical protein
MANGHGELTFSVWADTHFGYEQALGIRDLRWRVIEQTKHPGLLVSLVGYEVV